MKDIYYINRETNEKCKETVMGEGFIKWAYLSLSGKLFSSFIFQYSFLSKILGKYFDTKFSKSKIQKAIDELDIDTSEFLNTVDSFSSFNSFFYRKLKSEARPHDNSSNVLSSPADGRILLYHNIKRDMLEVKGARVQAKSLLLDEDKNFKIAHIAVIRLCPADYHRFHFPCDAKVSKTKKIKGYYHSVNPIALDKNKKIFAINKREYSFLETEFGKIIYMEVGAFGVAGIEQTYDVGKVNKMDEKGYFKFGGSTVILFFENKNIDFSDDLIKNSSEGMETLIKVGSTIALI